MTRSKLFLLLLCSCLLHAGETILKFNPDRIVTIAGTIQQVTEANWYGKKPNLLVTIETSQQGDRIKADAGLAELYTMTPAAGQMIQVTGSLVETEEGAVLLASEVFVDGKKVMVRTGKGIPTWVTSRKNPASRRGKHSFIHRRMRRGRH